MKITHLARLHRLGMDMSDKMWCGDSPGLLASYSTNVSDVDCRKCLGALVDEGERANNRLWELTFAYGGR